MKITLNVHLAGRNPYMRNCIRAWQKRWDDPESEIAVQFDPARSISWKCTLKDLHHPLEEEGVDFWWRSDWQQGPVHKVLGLDPLWMLNHYHYLDSSWKGNRPLTFSRYAGEVTDIR